MNRGVTRCGKTTVLRTGSTASSQRWGARRRRGAVRRGAANVLLLTRGAARQLAVAAPGGVRHSGRVLPTIRAANRKGNYRCLAVVPPERSTGFEPAASILGGLHATTTPRPLDHAREARIVIK